MQRAAPPGLVLIALAVAACMNFFGDEPARAEVNGLRYAVGPARGLTITEADLIRVGTIGQTNVEELFLNREAFAIRDVDPEVFLLVRAAPEVGDNPEDLWGEFIGLWGSGRDPDLCEYIDTDSVSFCP